MAHRPPVYFDQIPLSPRWAERLGAAGLLGLGAVVSLYLGLWAAPWSLPLGATQLDPTTLRLLVSAMGGALALLAADQLARLATLHRVEPFALRFGARALVLPTASFLRGLRTVRVDWRDITSIRVQRSPLGEAVEIRATDAATITLPGHLCAPPWRPARLAEAIRQELARRGRAT